MNERLFDVLEELGERISRAPHICLGLDFDGTLTPLVALPELANLSSSMRLTLQSLADQEKLTVAVLSGRNRADLQTRVDIPGLIYAGNHGLEISGPGFFFVEPSAAAHAQTLRRLAEDLTVRLQPLAGVWVEDKGLTVSVHFRQAAADAPQLIRQQIDDLLAQIRGPFRTTDGHRVYDIQPWVGWHKGAAMRWIQEKVNRPESLPIYLGDDVTDEDAFATLTGGIMVRVGASSSSSAPYHLDGPLEVQEFLEWLAECLALPASWSG
jgi:trehalose-phosphatase